MRRSVANLMKSRHDVATPTAIRISDWRAILVRVFWRVLADNVGLLAAGIAFYAFLSVFPAIAGALMIWGLFTDMPVARSAASGVVREVAPDAFDLVADQMVVIANPGRWRPDARRLHLRAVRILWRIRRRRRSDPGDEHGLPREREARLHPPQPSLNPRLSPSAASSSSALSHRRHRSRPADPESALARRIPRSGHRHAIRWLVIIALFMAACADDLPDRPFARSRPLALDHSRRHRCRRHLAARVDRLLRLPVRTSTPTTRPSDRSAPSRPC